MRKSRAPYRKVRFLGFTSKIIEDWGDKSYQPKLRYSLERAGDNWLRRKSEKFRKQFEAEELSVEETATQLSHLAKLKDILIDRALRRRFGGPANGGPPAGDQQ